MLPASVMVLLKDIFPMDRNLRVEGLVLQRAVDRLGKCNSGVLSILLKLVEVEGNTRLRIELAIPKQFPLCPKRNKTEKQSKDALIKLIISQFV